MGDNILKLFKKKKTKISVVVIIHNKEKYIEECLDSIVSQDIEKEIICVDDCSTDKTNEILKRYAEKYPEIKIVKNIENCGTILSRYNGLKKCNGDYFLFVDGDDKLLPNSLNILYNQAKSNSVDILEFSSETNGSKKLQDSLKLKTNIIDQDLLKAHNDKVVTNQLWNKLFSRKVYKKALSVMNPELKQDNFSDVIYFLYHFLSNAFNIYQTDIKGYYYYDDRGMTSNSSDVDRLKHYCNFYITYNELCSVYGESKELFYWKNIICNQAIDTYLRLNKKEQSKYRFELKKLMYEEEIEFLINEKV